MTPGTPLVVVHGHFYQPPREEPWLELVPPEPTATPDHDWNVRITRECYAPLGAMPVLDELGNVRQVLSAWEWLSFNVGPTLERWLERHAPDVVQAMVAGDRAALARTGHGNAIAQPFHHVILPLASRRDKRTEVRWGLREFRRVFGREARGMWLPETAVDEETLEVLAGEGVAFTIVAPHQVANPDPEGRPLRWSRDGRSVLLIPYDGPLSHGVAFGELLKDGERFAAGILATATGEGRGAKGGTTSPLANRPSPVAVTLATDGETYGHHHRFGDLALAVMLDRLRGTPGVRLAGSEALAATAVAGEAELVAPSSWSCEHGVKRWQEECGCRMEPGTSQAWRAPLRAGLEVLAAGLDAVVARDWPATVGALDEIRDAAGPDLDGVPDLPATARALLDAERHRLAMFTSCAWFFDDLARIEPRLVLRHAARALEFLPAHDREALEEALLLPLAMAHANDPAEGTGVDIWKGQVLPGRRAFGRLVAGLAAIRELVPDALEDLAMPAHRWQVEDDAIVLVHVPTNAVRQYRTTVAMDGIVPHHVRVHEIGGPEIEVAAGDFPSPIRQLLLDYATPLAVEACCEGEVAATLLSGGTPVDVIRREVFRGALARVARDGAGEAGVLLHAAMDLYDLAGDRPSLTERARAWQGLRGAADAPAAIRLADRLRIEPWEEPEQAGA